jgi:hypothetical protein
MILGLSFSAFTTLHVIISLIGIVSGIAVVAGMVESRHYRWLTVVFLATTVLTSATGFLFPFNGLLPSHIVGGISLVVLALTIAALYAFDGAGVWRWVYVIGALLSLYFNMFVGVVQAFQKLSFLQPLAPTQSEPPFLAAQIALLLAFAILGVLTIRRFHPVKDVALAV